MQTFNAGQCYGCNIIHILICRSLIQQLWRNILRNLAFDNVIWSSNGFSLMSPFIDVFDKICMQSQAGGILSTSSQRVNIANTVNFTQSRVHAETIFKGTNLMKDCRHTCSVEFTSREGLLWYILHHLILASVAIMF